MFELARQLSPLGNATAQECADYIVTLLSDLTCKVTLQNLYHDGGFSKMGMNDNLARLFKECIENAQANNQENHQEDPNS
jgi:enoyl-[acyl-carrier protein] reductase I